MSAATALRSAVSSASLLLVACEVGKPTESDEALERFPVPAAALDPYFPPPETSGGWRRQGMAKVACRRAEWVGRRRWRSPWRNNSISSGGVSWSASPPALSLHAAAGTS